MKSVSRRGHSIIFLLFFFSGAIALGYQVIWSKFLLEFIGVSAYSYSTVLASFMGGLALGSWWLGKRVDRSESPLKVYAFLELGIGLYAVFYRQIAFAAADLYAGWVHYTPEQAGATAAIWAKILISGLLLVVPTFLMGGT